MRISAVRVGDFMIRTGELNALASLHQAALSMSKNAFDCLPVTDGGHRLVGILTAHAVATATAANRRDPYRTFARHVMTKDFCRCYADEDAEAASRAMTTRRANRAVVLDREERPIGILALGDLAMRNGYVSSFKATVDCDRLEQRWIAAARAALNEEGRHPGGRGSGRSLAPPDGQPRMQVLNAALQRKGDIARSEYGNADQPSPHNDYVEAYLDYHA